MAQQSSFYVMCSDKCSTVLRRYRYNVQQITEIRRTTNNVFEELIGTPQLAGFT